MNTHRHPRAGRLGARTLAVPFALLVALACQDPATQSAVDEAASPPDQLVAQADASGVTAFGTIALPINQTTSTATPNPAFGVKQTGTGPDAVFTIQNSASASHALTATTNGKGRAGSFQISNTSSSASAIFAQTNSSGMAINATTNGTGSAGKFTLNKTTSTSPALAVTTNGHGPAISATSTGTGDGLDVTNSGDGVGVLISKTGAQSAALLVEATNLNFQSAAVVGRGWGANGKAALFQGFQGAAGVTIQSDNGTVGLSVTGGSKNAIVGTASGARALYTEESSEVWFTDYGFGTLQDGRTRILLDPTFAQTVSVEEPYHVFLQARGDADMYVAETTPLGFTVVFRGGNDRNAEFSYRVVAKRKGFETKRLDRMPWADNTVE
jgi:hypothetical protein